MALNRDTFFNNLDSGATWAAGVAFQRSNPLPLDKYSVFRSLTEAEAYAQTNAVSYIGQNIVVVTETSVDMYLIADADGTLKKLATTTVSGDLANDVAVLQGKVTAVETAINDAKGSEDSLKDRIDAVETTANAKVAGITVGNGIEKTGTDTAPVLDVKVDTVEGNLIEKTETGLKVIAPEQTDYTVTVETPTGTEYSASYVFKQLGNTLATINIPKDMVVSQGEVVTYTDETKPAEVATAGTYIVLTIANKAADKLYINVSDLLDDKTVEGVTGADITVTADSSEGPVKISATINEGAVQTTHIANSAITTDKINVKAVTTEKIADGAVDETQIKDNAVTTGKILDSAVTTDKINAKAVTSAKIDDGAVTETQIADEAVTINKIASAAKTTTIVKDAASDTTVPTTKAVTDYVDTAIEDGSVQTVAVSGGTNNGTVKLTVDGVATDNIAVTGWDTKADEVKVERIKYYDDPDIIPSDENYFTVNETGDTITGLSEAGKTQTELVIPYEIDGKKITTLYSGSEYTSILDGNKVITKVVIPNSVTTIGGAAFCRCGSLTSINIPNSVTSIGDSAFDGCYQLDSIEIPNGVRTIGNSAFDGVDYLTSIKISNSVTTIGEYAFRQCFSLTSANIPNSVTSIGDHAFHELDFDSQTYLPISGLTIYCEQGSYAETYANTNNIPVIYTDIKASTIDAKANAADVYTKTEVDTELAKKADKTYVDTELAKKANSATTISGYGITDAYTKTEVDSAITERAVTPLNTHVSDTTVHITADERTRWNNTYTKTETDTAISSAVASAGHLKRQIVTELPTTDLDVDTIYMIKRGTSETGDNYEEYMVVDGVLVKIGDTTVDLTDYLTKTGDSSDTTVTFTEAAEKTELTTGDKISVLFGKIKKWFSSLHPVATSGDYRDLQYRIYYHTATQTQANATYLIQSDAPFSEKYELRIYSVELYMNGEKVLGDVSYANHHYIDSEGIESIGDGIDVTVSFSNTPSSSVEVRIMYTITPKNKQIEVQW